MRKEEKLRRLYAQLPRLNCQKKCQDVCGPIPLTGAELRIIRDHTSQKEIYADKDLTCGLLKNGECSVYHVRPMMCRLWGLIDNPKMKCPHGCVPDRWLTDKEAHAFMDEAKKISGGDTVVLMPKDFYAV